jgi:hypothetical protein
MDRYEIAVSHDAGVVMDVGAITPSYEGVITLHPITLVRDGEIIAVSEPCIERGVYPQIEEIEKGVYKRELVKLLEKIPSGAIIYDSPGIYMTVPGVWDVLVERRRQAAPVRKI